MAADTGPGIFFSCDRARFRNDKKGDGVSRFQAAVRPHALRVWQRLAGFRNGYDRTTHRLSQRNSAWVDMLFICDHALPEFS
jgi:hypothetical protein